MTTECQHLKAGATHLRFESHPAAENDKTQN